MAASTFPSASNKTRYVVTLLSGTSWTVPAGVTYINVLRKGGDGGDGAISGGVGGAGGDTTFTGLANATGGVGASINFGGTAQQIYGKTGIILQDYIATTPGASITYAIGAAGDGHSTANDGLQGFVTIEWWV